MTAHLNLKLWWLAIALAIVLAALLGPSIDGSITTDSYYHRPVPAP